MRSDRSHFHPSARACTVIPGQAAALVAVTTTWEFVARGTSLREIIFCCYSAADLETYERLLHS